MTLRRNCKIPIIKILVMLLIMYSIFLLLLRSHNLINQPVLSSSSLRFLHTKAKQLCPTSDYTTDPPVYLLDETLRHLTFSPNITYHHNGIAYDYYSIIDLQQSKASCIWKIWPLTNQINQTSSIDPIEISPLVKSKLPFIDVIYVITDPRLTERHSNLKKAFDHQGISLESIRWRMKWNRTTCNSNTSHSYVYQRLNLKEKPLEERQQRICALTMKHVDVWYEMAEQNVGLSLILEDDAIFVPFFKEKLTRMISAAMSEGILRLNGSCVKPKTKVVSDNEQIEHNPMIVIGICYKFHDQHFQSNLLSPPPIFSSHKSNPSRCTHAYLLTSCSAQALVDQIQSQKNDLVPPDFLQNDLFVLSSTLQSYWVDPPLSYQGNQVVDLDEVSSFRIQTYMSND